MTSLGQREAWRGAFGDTYTARNARTEASLASRARLFRRVLAPIDLGPRAAVLEIGTNLGMNLEALTQVADVRPFGVDVNHGALTGLRATPGLSDRARVVTAEGQRLPFADASMALVVTCGVLIHVHPSELLETCREMVRVSRRYLFCAEYFSPRPETIEYRGRSDLLFKRDFGGFFLDHWPWLRVVDYGFVWKRVEFDDLTWWLFERPEAGR